MNTVVPFPEFNYVYVDSWNGVKQRKNENANHGTLSALVHLETQRSGDKSRKTQTDRQRVQIKMEMSASPSVYLNVCLKLSEGEEGKGRQMMRLLEFYHKCIFVGLFSIWYRIEIKNELAGGSRRTR